MNKKAKTSPRVASLAAKLLRSKTQKAVKSVAASALTQTDSKQRRKKEQVK